MARELAGPPLGWDYAAAYADVKARVHLAEARAGRSGAGVRILVATKAFDTEALRAACAAGATMIGESRMQELAAKGQAASDAGARIHVIGPLQRNKAREAVTWAHCVQTVDSVELAERLSRLCLEAERERDVMIQVNVSGEEQKHGVARDEARDLATAVQALPALTVTGFMTVGLNSVDEAAVRAGYAQLREIRDRTLIAAEAGTHPSLRSAWELSMGMSHDLEWAIAEGATIVRVGSAIMGPRPVRD